MQNRKNFILVLFVILISIFALIFFKDYLKLFKKKSIEQEITPIIPTLTPETITLGYRKMLDNKVLEKVIVEPKNAVVWVKKNSVEQGDKIYMPFDGKLIVERRSCYKNEKGKNVCDFFGAVIDEKNKIRVDFNGRMESSFKDGEYFVKKSEVIANFDKENTYSDNIAVFQVTKNYNPYPDLIKELFK